MAFRMPLGIEESLRLRTSVPEEQGPLGGSGDVQIAPTPARKPKTDVVNIHLRCMMKPPSAGAGSNTLSPPDRPVDRQKSRNGFLRRRCVSITPGLGHVQKVVEEEVVSSWLGRGIPAWIAEGRLCRPISRPRIPPARIPAPGTDRDRNPRSSEVSIVTQYQGMIRTRMNACFFTTTRRSSIRTMEKPRTVSPTRTSRPEM